MDPSEKEAFSRGLSALNAAGVPYMVAGAFAKYVYTGVWRDTNDLDVVLRPRDLKRALAALGAAGFDTRVEDRRWLAKAFRGPYLIDLVFAMSNGIMPVTDEWFSNSGAVELAGVKARLIPLEELIAAKVYVALRERFDGADIVHLIRNSRGNVNWERVLAMLGPNRQLLLWYLILFDYVYPGLSAYLPRQLILDLIEEMRAGWASEPDSREFRGTLIDPYSFAVDVEEWDYREPRDLHPLVSEEGDLL